MPSRLSDKIKLNSGKHPISYNMNGVLIVEE